MGIDERQWSSFKCKSRKYNFPSTNTTVAEKIKAHSILVLRFKKKKKKKEGKQGRKMRYSLTYIQINTQYTLAMYIITYIAQNIN